MADVTPKQIADRLAELAQVELLDAVRDHGTSLRLTVTSPEDYSLLLVAVEDLGCRLAAVATSIRVTLPPRVFDAIKAGDHPLPDVDLFPMPNDQMVVVVVTDRAIMGHLLDCPSSWSVPVTAGDAAELLGNALALGTMIDSRWRGD